jgi:glycosyltransferase involved in cell wall biosynthesis
MITVCLPSFNGAQFIGEQLRSILDSAQVDEVLVSDDGSTDQTVELVRAVADSRVQILEGPRQGVVRNVESLLRRARGDLIFLADQDDVWLPRRVDVMARALESADLVLCNCQVVDTDLRPIYRSFFERRHSRQGLLANLWRNSYLGCCMAFRRTLLAHALPFPRGTPMHDWWLGLVAERRGTTAFIDEPLLLYRRHGGNATPTLERFSATRWQQLRWRLSLVKALFARELRSHV